MNYPKRPLGDVLELDLKQVPVQSEETYQIAGVYGYGRGLFARGAIKGSDTQYKHLHQLRSSTLVLSKLKAFEGALTVVAPNYNDHFLSPEFPTFTIDQTQADIYYIANLCRWPTMWKLLAGKSVGIGSRRERVSPASLLATRVPLPDLDEQRRVAAKLDSMQSKINQIAALRSESAKIRRGLCDALFNGLRDIKLRRIGELVELERIPAEVHSGETYVQIGIRSFGKGIFHRPPVQPEGLSKLKYFQLRPGRLIVSNIMAWEGAVAVSTPADQGCLGSQRFLSYAPTGQVEAAYLNYFFQTQVGRQLLANTSTGTVTRNQTLSIKDFEEIMVPLPPMQVQQEIVRKLDVAQGTVGSLASRQSASIVTTGHALLNAAFTGQL